MTQDRKPAPITLRHAIPDDEPFLYELYRTTRIEEMVGWGWDDAQLETFLRLQFTAQRYHYDAAYPEADHRILLRDSRPAGRLLVFRSEEEILLVDITLLPADRGAGIGASLIKDLLDEADQAGKSVTLHVAKDNRARRLYERLGFEVIEDTGMYFKMEWRPGRP